MSDSQPVETQSVGRTVLFNTLILGAVFLCYFFTTYRMGEDAQTVGVIALLTVLVARPRWATSFLPWLAVLGSLLFTLSQRPLDVPNHHFMMSYLAAAMVLILTAPRHEQPGLFQIGRGRRAA